MPTRSAVQLCPSLFPLRTFIVFVRTKVHPPIISFPFAISLAAVPGPSLKATFPKEEEDFFDASLRPQPRARVLSKPDTVETRVETTGLKSALQWPFQY